MFFVTSQNKIFNTISHRPTICCSVGLTPRNLIAVSSRSKLHLISCCIPIRFVEDCCEPVNWKSYFYGAKHHIYIYIYKMYNAKGLYHAGLQCIGLRLFQSNFSILSDPDYHIIRTTCSVRCICICIY